MLGGGVGSMERDDLVSWGMMGLVNAARAWDPKRSRSFSTLACRAIERMIIRGVNREWKPDREAASVSLDQLIAGNRAEGGDDRFVDQLPADENVERRMIHTEQQEAVRTALHTLSDEQEDAFAQSLDHFSRKLWRKPRVRRKFRYDLAMLADANESMPPSNKRALKSFVEAGAELGIEVDTITRNDYARLAEYDALFIRATTALDNHTYRFANRAEKEDMVVIDDPSSILKCTNKIYLHDLLKSRKLATPRTEILYRDEPKKLADLPDRLGFPIVLKIPDGSFSRGIVKVENAEQLKKAADDLFQHTALVLAQEFMFTEFDWRIGVLNREPLYACKYFMSRGHWQIYNHGAKGTAKSGGFETLPVRSAPGDVLKLALKATAPIGDGLYGVDLKQAGDRLVVIEVNDNPSIDAGVEDAYLGEDLYRRIMGEFLRRMERKRLGQRG